MNLRMFGLEVLDLEMSTDGEQPKRDVDMAVDRTIETAPAGFEDRIRRM